MRIVWILFFVAYMTTLLPAQSQQVDSFFIEKIVQGFEARLDQPGGDIADQFILREVKNHCKEDYNCLKNAYSRVLSQLEGSFRHFAAVAVAKELERLAEKNRDFDMQASVVGRLAAIYAFVGNNKMRIFYQEKLLALYVQSGDTEKILYTKSHILEGRVWYLNEAADVLPEMKKILEQALKEGYTDFANRWRIRIKYVCEEYGFDEEFVEQVKALEKIPLSAPLQPSEYHIAFHASSGRGDILRKEKKYDQARSAYLKALDVFRTVDNSHHDTWLCIYVLFRLAKLERERGDVTEAKKFLEEAYVIADDTNMHDRAILYLGMKAEIAEAEKNYEDALRFTKEIMSRQAILDSLSEGLDMEKYHIQLEREQLAAEKQNQALELAQRQNQLMYTTVIVVLVGLLALGLFISLRKQRQARRALLGQNALILQQSEQLKSLDAAKSRFFANVSHELRTPLTLMLGPVKTLLQENQLSEK